MQTPTPRSSAPVEKCVDHIVRLLVKRKREVLLPWFAGPLLALDGIFGKHLGNQLLAWKFPPDKEE